MYAHIWNSITPADIKFQGNNLVITMWRSEEREREREIECRIW